MTRAERRQAVLSLAETRQVEYDVRRKKRKEMRDQARSQRSSVSILVQRKKRARQALKHLKGAQQQRVLRKFGEIA